MIKNFSLHCIEKVLFFIGIFLLTSEILKQLLLTYRRGDIIKNNDADGVEDSYLNAEWR